MGFLLGNAPTEIDVHQFHLPLAAPPPELGKHLPHEQVSFIGKVPERRADEDPYGAAVSHSQLPKYSSAVKAGSVSGRGGNRRRLLPQVGGV